MVITTPMSKLHPPFSQLRPVMKTEVEFEELKQSIRKHGVLKPPVVRKSPRVEGHYEIIDGMWRYSAAKELDIREMCVTLIVADDDEVLSLQILLNSVGYDTTDLEYAKQLQVLVNKYEKAGCPISYADLAQLCCKSTAWVSSRLSLNNLHKDCKAALEKGQIKLGHGVQLAKLSKPEQVELLEFAKNNTVRELTLKVGGVILQGKKKSLENSRDTMVAGIKSHVRRKAEIMDELENMRNMPRVLAQRNATTPGEIVEATLEWVLNLSPENLERIEENVKTYLTKDEERGILVNRRYKELEGIEETLRQRKQEKLEKLEYVKARISDPRKRVHERHDDDEGDESGSGSSTEQQG